MALSFLDQSIVATALPVRRYSSPRSNAETRAELAHSSFASLQNISASFNSGRASSWVASAYLLTGTAFQPIWGRCSDM